MNRHLRLITTTTLPLIFVIGCASTDTRDFSNAITNSIDYETSAIQEAETDVAASVQLAINNMDGYINRLEQEQGLAQSIDVTSETNIQNEVKPTEETTEMTVLIVEEGVVFDALSNNITPAESEIIDQQIEIESLATAVPEMNEFFFGLNKTQPGDADKAVLIQHAEYLLQHPSLVLVVSGHADSRGNKQYNQYLSELRAQNIAAILIAAGVPEHQLRVTGMGDNVPMVDSIHWDENRRVELLYRDVMMLSSQ